MKSALTNLSFAIIVAAAILPVAVAGGSGASGWHPSGERGATSSSSSAALAAAQSDASQSQAAQGGAGGSSDATGGTSSAQGGSATQTQQASNAGNAQSVATSYSYPRQTPMAMAGFVQPTIPCATARNAGASSPVVGLAFGFSGHDKECDLREDARLFYEFGQTDLAVRLLCKDAAKFGLKNCKYVAPKPTEIQRTVVITKPPQNYVTQKELQRAIKTVLEK